jgi:hypothetical protein
LPRHPHLGIGALAIAAVSGSYGRALACLEQAPDARRVAMDPSSKLSLRHAKINA